MQFQPGQSGNPAGRPHGARNKKTIAMEEIFAATAQETAKFIVARAQCGNATAMRICVERTPPALELSPVRCAADAQKALDTVIDAFSRGALTVREFPSMIAAVERMTRTAERIQALREAEDERPASPRVPGVHGEDLYSPVNSGAAPGTDPAEAATASHAKESPNETLAPSLPRERSERGDGGERSEPGGGIVCSERASPPTPDPSPPRFAWGEGNPEAVPDTEGEGLYFPVNSDASTAKAHARGGVLRKRRHKLMTSVAPSALLAGGGLTVDPRSYVTDQMWMASLKETGPHGAAMRKAA